ncbi:hypothetical protein P764_gp45 [Propionibacterium phage PHL060L00]|uniref:Uncharacterized protein n=1 Tax=Propionibacterium phage PHL060L00 TaxID=1235647 RepID=T1R4M8_9CAUD|nr:hypothetical protein P764_gp45 [Propionibacterium phage PHL060L00]AGI12540.1 hypothetical protein PHL060L00_45 [Propionibacterium phage PHL060L00]
MIFLTCQGGSGENKHPTTNRTPLKHTKQGLGSISRARARYSYPQTIPGRYRGK